MSHPITFDDFSSALLVMAGHDVRQPLQLITAAHDRLARFLHGSEQRQELARAAAATTQLAEMLNQLVEAVRLREQSGDDLHVIVPLRPILDGLASEFTKPAWLKGVSLRIPPAGHALLSHPVLLTGMLRNLIRNAIDYTPRGGAVCVTCCRYGSELRIEVRDTGVGIRANALPAIFKAFQRSDESGVDGLGPGLFIAKYAADLLGHRVRVRSAEGIGSTFAIITNAVPDTARAV